MRNTRRSLSQEQQQTAALGLFQQFRHSPLHLSAKRVGLYIANDGEIDPCLLLSDLLGRGRQVALPCLDPCTKSGKNRIQFALTDKTTRLQPNRFGIDQPADGKLVNILGLDLVLVPLVAFDDSGNRLGMGGGFYDRTFAIKRTQPNLGPKLIGLAHECQRSDKLKAENWDIPLDGILTGQTYLPIYKNSL